MNPLLYPIITLMHMSNPVMPPAREVTVDYFGAGFGVQLNSGLSIETTIGVTSLGCVAPDCGRQPAAKIEFTWRGRKRQ